MKIVFARLVLPVLCLLLLPMCERIAQSRAEQAFLSGAEKLSDGNVTGAIADFTEAIRLNPKLAAAYVSRGACRGQLGILETALSDLDEAIRLDANSAHAFATRGVILEQRRELDAALADFDRAITLDPGLAWAWGNRGRLKQQRQDLAGARTDLDKAVALNPGDANALLGRANLFQQTGDFDAALADLDRAIALAPGRAHGYAGRASMKTQMNDLAGALKDFDKALDLDSELGFAYRGRAFLRMKQADWSAALRDLRTYCEKPGAEQDYPRLFIWICRARSGDAKVASEDLTNYLATRPKASRGDWVAKLGAHLIGTLPEDQLLAAAPTAPDPTTAKGQQCEAWYYIGIKKSLAGDTAGAAAAFQACLDTDVKGFVEYTQAGAELGRLKGG